MEELVKAGQPPPINRRATFECAINWDRYFGLAAFVLLTISASSIRAAADCPRNYEITQKALLDADYVRQARDIIAWRDLQFRLALNQYNTERRIGSKTIYDQLEIDRARLRDRIAEGDLRESTQKQRSEAAHVIGSNFRGKIGDLLQDLKQQYNDRIARTREDVSDMRRASLEFYAEDRQYLEETIKSGCSELRKFRFRSVFIWVSNKVGAGKPYSEPPVIGSAGSRG